MGQTPEQQKESTLYQEPTTNWAIKSFVVPYINILRAALQTTISGSAVVKYTLYNITNAVGNTITVQVEGIDATNISQGAIDMNTGQFGTYNITTDVFTPNT